MASQRTHRYGVFLRPGEPYDSQNPEHIRHKIDDLQAEFSEYIDLQQEGGWWKRKADGVNGQFHCLKCLEQGFQPSHFQKMAKFWAGTIADYFVHYRTAGGPCHNYTRPPPEKTQVLNWEFLMLQTAIYIEDRPHRLLAYLSPPTGNASTKQSLRDWIKHEYHGDMHWTDQVPDQNGQDGSDKRNNIVKTLQGWDEDADSMTFVIGFPKTSCLSPITRTIDGTRFRIHSELRPADATCYVRMFERTDDHLLQSEMFEQWETQQYSGHAPYLYSRVPNSTMPLEQEGAGANKRFIYRPSSTRSVLLTFPGGVSPNEAGQTRHDAVLGEIAFADDAYSGAELLREGFPGHLILDEASVKFSFDRSARPVPVKDVEGFTHVIVKPPNEKRSFRFYRSGSQVREAIAVSNDQNLLGDLENAEDLANLTQIKLEPIENRIHRLNVRGSGLLHIYGLGLSKHGSRTFVQGHPSNNPTCALVTGNPTVEEQIVILKALLPHLSDYHRPASLNALNVELYADLMRHIAHKEINLEQYMPPHKLSRAMSLLSDLTEEEEDNKVPARTILENTFEVMYGAWDHVQPEPEGIDDLETRRFRLSKDAEGWFGPEDSAWKLFFDVRSLQQLKEETGIRDDDLVLLPNGMRLIKSQRCEALGTRHLEEFPHAERLPIDAYGLLQGCFVDEEREAEERRTVNYRTGIQSQDQDAAMNTLDLERFTENRELRMFKNDLRSEDAIPHGWSDLDNVDRPLTLEDTEGGRMEINCYVHVDPDSTYFGGKVQRTFLLTYTPREQNPRTCVVFSLKNPSREAIPYPWRKYAQGLQERDFRYFRYDLLHTVLRAFLSCVHQHTRILAFEQRATDLLPVRHRHLLRNKWSSEVSSALLKIQEHDQDLAAWIEASIRRAFWLPENGN